MKRITLIIAEVLIIAISLCPQLSAAENGIYELEDSIPRDVAEYLPEEVFSGDANESTEALTKISGLAFILKYILRILTGSFPKVLPAFFSLLGIAVMCGTLKTFTANMKTSVGECASVCISFCLASIVFGIQYLIVRATEEYLVKIATVMRSMIPVMSAIYTAGGNFSSASANGCGMLVFLSVSELVLSNVLLPMVKICFALFFAGLISGNLGFGGVGEAVKKAAVFFLTFIASVIGAVTAFQSVLSQSADNAASRIVKFSLGSFVPIVGSALSDTVRSMSTGLSLVKNSVGIFGIVIIVLIALPPLIFAFLHKFSFFILSAVSGMLGCEREARFFTEVSGLQNLIIAIICISSLLFVMSMSVFVASSLAMGT